jgi:hypothetical protein
MYQAAAGGSRRRWYSISLTKPANDERVKFFADMVGLGSEGYVLPNYMVAFYVALIVPTGLHMDEVFGQNVQVTLPVSIAYSLFMKYG